MSILSNLWEKTFIYKTYASIKNLYLYCRDYNYICDTFYSEEFKIVLKKYLNIEVSKDWIGRLYGIINPNIDIDGNFNFNNVIIEIDGDETNNNEYVKTWIWKQMNLIGYMFKIQNLYSYIGIEIKHVGPVNHDNYLVIFDITSRKKFTYFFKKWLIQALVYSILIISTYVYCTGNF